VGNDVAIWPINADGTLGTEGTPATISPTNEPVGLAVSTATTGSFLFVGSNDTTSSVEAFNPNNPVAGVLGAETGTPSASGDVPYNLVVDSTKQFVYAANVDIASVSGYRIGPGGALTVLGTSPFGTTGTNPLVAPYGVAASPIGQFVYVTDLGLVPPAPSLGSVNLYSYDGTGALTFVASYPVGTSPYGIAIDPSGQFLYVSNSADNTVSGFTIDPTLGTLTPIPSGSAVATGATGAELTATALVVDPSSQYLYVTTGDSATLGDSVSLMTITQGSGLPVLVGTPVPASNTGIAPGAGTTAIAIK
jgi:DNA-binding beta-propeller fold protein YncE